MKRLPSRLSRRLKPGPFIWSCALGAAGLFFALPELLSPGAFEKLLADLRNHAITEVQKHLPTPVGSGLTGTATVIDGDTIDIHQQRIRFHAMDAPEAAQRCWRGGTEWRCGQAASLALQEKINRRPVRCEQTDKDRYGRIVARCFVGETDLNGWLVEEGLALAAPQYGKDYIAHEARARRAEKGMWAGEFIVPSDWRKGMREPHS